MKICFIEDKSIINHDQYIMRLGELTCEQLNGVDKMCIRDSLQTIPPRRRQR